jgi:hypothetical protein
MIHQIPVSSLSLSLYFLIRIHAGPNTVVKDTHSLFSLLSLLRSLIPHEHIVHTTLLAIHSLSQRAFIRSLNLSTDFGCHSLSKHRRLNRGQQTPPLLVSPFRNRNSHSVLRASVPIAHLCTRFLRSIPAVAV